MVTLLLMRHGETPDNVSQIMQGQTQGRLNDRGIRQAEEVRDKLSARHLDAVVSSDLQRAVTTAQIVAQPHRLNVVTTPLLRERDWGDFTGCFIPSLQGKPLPANVESIDCLLERAQRFLDYIQQEYDGMTVLAVGHGIINKAIQAVARQCTMREVQKMTNAEIRTLTLDK